MPFRTVAVVGVGLIGGSFALAMRKAGFTGVMLGVSSPETISQAVGLGVVDHGVPLGEAIARADLIYLAQPISRILATIPDLDAAKPRALITDAGSTKLQIVEAAAARDRKAQFLGGHPMAGKETRGVKAATADLFHDRTYFLTPREMSEMNTPAGAELLVWLKRMGARVMPIAPAAHDRLVAHTSHLAQLASTALSVTLAERLGPAARSGAGPGLVDMTRLSMSAYDIWADILATNTAEIDSALALYIERLSQLRERLAAGDLRDSFEIASDFAKSLRNPA